MSFQDTSDPQSSVVEKIRVLHIDDERGLAEMAGEFLEREDDRIQVETATNASDGLDRIDADVDCIVSDYDMPGQNGIELLETVRKRYPDLPFILFTGKGSEEVASEAISAGVTDYLQKETGTEQYELLANRITNAVSQHHAEQQAAETKRRLRELTEATDDVLWMFTADWSELLFINSPYEDIWGVSIERLQDDPRAFLEAVHPEDRERVAATMERLSNGKSADIEFRVNPDEEYRRWVWARGEPIYDEAGEVVRVAGFTRNITERKKRQRELQRHDRQFEAVFNSPDSFIGILDPDGTLRMTNQTALEFADVDPQQVEGEPFWETPWWTHSADLQQRLQNWIKRAANGEHVRYEASHLAPDNEKIIVDGIVRPVTDEDGEIVSLMVEAREITERKQHESAIEDLHSTAQALLQTQTREEVAEIIVDAIDDILQMPVNAVWFCDDDQDILRPVAWTERATEVVGDIPTFSADEGLAWTTFETGECQYFDDVSEVADRLNPDTNVRSEIILPIGDHGVITIGSTDVDAFDERDISLAQIVATHTEAALYRIQHEEELTTTTRRLEAILDNTMTPMFLKNDDGEYLLVNTGYRELFDLQDEEIIGRTDAEIHPQEMADEVGTNDSMVLEHGEPLETEERIVVDEEERVYLVSKVPIHDIGTRSDPESPVAVFGVAQDITERKRYEQELERQNDRLEEITSVISHDLQGPLSVVEGGVQLARSERDSHHLDRVEQAIERAQTLIDDLLTLAREGDDLSDVSAVDLASTAEACWQGIETEDATLVTEPGVTVQADGCRLQQLLQNLIENAVAHGGEEVTVTVGAMVDGFYIADDGPGIPQDERDRVFESGYSTSASGTGLGLSIVEQIVDLHGWEISVTEGSEGGARFEISDVEAVSTDG